MPLRRPLVALGCLFLAPVSSAWAELGAKLISDQLHRPVYLTAPSGDERLFVVEQEGQIQVLAQGGRYTGTFLDLSDHLPARVFGERGLLGLAFSPHYVSDGLFYVCYTREDWSIVVSRLRVSPDPDVADASSEEILLDVPKDHDDHNGGHLEFGPDGYLYIGLGDGGAGGDPSNNAQKTTTLLGKILRIDVSGGLFGGYSIPPDNPFGSRRQVPPAENEPRPEIWAIGLRNPRTFSFDGETGDLYIPDVGQNRREEINAQRGWSEGGANFGWRVMEGSLCFEPPDACERKGLVLPVYEYDHSPPSELCEVVGGVVYRGPAIELNGHYLFADHCTGRVFSFVWDGEDGTTSLFERTDQLRPARGSLAEVSAIARDGLGHVYFLNVTGGKLFRLEWSQGLASAESPGAPLEPMIEVASPNPMTSSMSIRVNVPDDATANVAVYNTAGRQVRSLGTALRGPQVLTWDGQDATGIDVAPGVYIVQVATLGQVDRLGVTVVR